MIKKIHWIKKEMSFKDFVTEKLFKSDDDNLYYLHDLKDKKVYYDISLYSTFIHIRNNSKTIQCTLDYNDIEDFTIELDSDSYHLTFYLNKSVFEITTTKENIEIFNDGVNYR